MLTACLLFMTPFALFAQFSSGINSLGLTGNFP